MVYEPQGLMQVTAWHTRPRLCLGCSLRVTLYSGAMPAAARLTSSRASGVLMRRSSLPWSALCSALRPWQALAPPSRACQRWRLCKGGDQGRQVQVPADVEDVSGQQVIRAALPVIFVQLLLVRCQVRLPLVRCQVRLLLLHCQAARAVITDLLCSGQPEDSQANYCVRPKPAAWKMSEEQELLTGGRTHPWSPSALDSASDRLTSPGGWPCSSISVEAVGFRASGCFPGPLRSLQTPTTVSQIAALAPRIGTSLAFLRARESLQSKQADRCGIHMPWRRSTLNPTNLQP